jgi:antirestriction protein ArdC
VHWTGHASRCTRDLKNRFGSEAYAMEELVAELGAAFLCADLGVTPELRPDHASYIANWLSVLKSDKKAIFTAASKAQQAANYLTSLTGERP